MNQNLATMTPVEIDTLLAPIWEREAEAKAQVLAYTRRSSELQRKAAKLKNGLRVQGYTTPGDGIRLAETIQHLNAAITELHDKLALISIEALPYENEYVRRGGWNRVFLAKSHDGHAHNGTECSTCHNGEFRTEFAWLIQYSGLPEAEIVADAGERACTTCYKSAPANAKGTKMYTPDEVEAQRAREEREAARARRAQEAADKSITTPEGTPLYENKDNSSYAKIKNIRTAEIAATDALKDLIFAQRHATDPEWAWRYESGRLTPEREQMEYARHAWCLIRSIAAKKGQTFEETFEVHEKKAQAKVRKTDRDWAKNPCNPNRTK
jgi:hypothetical protein